MNPLFLLALAGGGYVLYQQSQGKSLFGGEECPSKIVINGHAFMRELMPGLENGGVMTKAMNDAGIFVDTQTTLEQLEHGKIKKFLSSNYTKKLSDKIFKILVPSGCKKSDKDVLVCLPLSSAGAGNVMLLEMHLPTFHMMIHSVLIGTFASLFETIASEEDNYDDKLAKCQALIGKELEWWRKTMGLEGDIQDDLKGSVVPQGDYKLAELPEGLLDFGSIPISPPSIGDLDIALSDDEDIDFDDADIGSAGTNQPGSRDSRRYVMTDTVFNNLRDFDEKLSTLAIELPDLDPRGVQFWNKADSFARTALREIAQAYEDPSIGQKAPIALSELDTNTALEAPPGLISPAGLFNMTLLRAAVAMAGNDLMARELIAVPLQESIARSFGKEFEKVNFKADEEVIDMILSMSEPIKLG